MIIFICKKCDVSLQSHSATSPRAMCMSCIAEFMFAPQDLPTLVSVLSHLVTGAHAQQAAQLCPQVPCLLSAGFVPCSLSVHRAVCPCVSSTGILLAVHTMVCPWIPHHVFSVSVHALRPSHPIFQKRSVQERHGPDSHFPHNQDLIQRLSWVSALSGPRPPLSP